MATNDSTAHATGSTTTEFIDSACRFCCGMEAFFELADHEFRLHNNTDFDGLEFLVKSAKAEFRRFVELAYDIQLDAEAQPA